MFPVVERAIDFALDNQHPSGEIEWDADPARVDGKGALLTGSSSIYSSLRCAIAAAERLGHERPDWELSLGSLAIAIAHRPDRFLDKDRWAMDWYYPILVGVLRGRAAEARLAAKWDTFVAPGRGVRCVSDQPWVTAAETCELVMALDAIGLHERARTLFDWVQFLRHDDGSYWTGMNFENDRYDAWGEYFTAEQPTWNSAAVVLAANALGGSGPTSGLFRGEGLPGGLTAGALVEAAADMAMLAALEIQPQVLHLLDVVTTMCDHVIEYIEADRAERRLMIETLTQLGRVVTDRATAAVAAEAAPSPPLAVR